MTLRVGFRRHGRQATTDARIGYMLDGIQNALVDIGQQNINMQRKPVRTWTGDKPDWKGKVQKRGVNFRLTIEMQGSTFARKKWWWLDQGTKDRYATMTKDFKPKTEHRVIGSKAGRGGVAYVSVHVPRPGIQAREWNDEIKKRLEPRVQKKLDTAITRALSRQR